MNNLISAITELLSKGERVLVAIDGRCGGGKTTLAAELATRFECTVLHMDDFFLRPEQRSAERLAQPGENVDHERFLEEVLLPLAAGKSFCYRPFDCAKMELGAPVAVTPTPLTVVEGSYSLHPTLREYYDLRVFVDVDPTEQMERIVKRNPLSANTFRERWIPLEEKYFAAYDVAENCDIIIKI